jgi:hypothetical protein
MKLKIIIFLSILLIILTSVINYNLHTIKYFGIKLTMPFIVNKELNDNRITVTKIPRDGTLLILLNKDLNFKEYKEKVLLKSQSEVVTENKILDLKDGGGIELVKSRLLSSPQTIIEHGYIEKKKILFTFYGTIETIKLFNSSLEKISYYD